MPWTWICGGTPTMGNDWIRPDWPAPANVRAISTTRAGGTSRGAYASLNLGGHVGDDPTAVAENRQRLLTALDLRYAPRWLKQVHSNRVAYLKGSEVHAPCDAAVAQSADEVCAILTADCLPVLFCDHTGHTAAAAHAGWRGLAVGVLEATVAAMGVPAAEILAWLGPAIGAEVYEVGEEVRRVMVGEHPEAEQAFEPTGSGRWLCDLYLLASQRLRRAGLRQIYGGGFCTYSDRARFFSYRRDGECGRMATLIWLTAT